MQTSRRSALKGAAGVAATGLLGVVPASASPGSAQRPIVIEASFDSPITNAEINRRRSEVAQLAAANGSDPIPVEPRTELSATDARMVSLALWLDDDERLQQSVGFASGPKDVAKAHKDSRNDAAKAGSGSLTTDSVETTNSGWTEWEDSKITNYEDPYGDFINYYTYSTNGDYNAYTERFAMVPGKLEYNSKWENDSGVVDHFWSDDWAELSDWGPFGGTSGTVSTGISLDRSGPTFTYQYTTQDTTVDDQTSDQDNNPQFIINFKSGARSETNGFDPGSKAHTTDSGTRGTVYLSTSNHATFYKDDFWDIENYYHNNDLMQAFKY